MYKAPSSAAKTEVRRPERAGMKNAAVRRMLGGASLLLLSACLGRVGGGRFFTAQTWTDACQAGALVFVLMFGESGRTAPTSTEVMLSTCLGASIGALGVYLQSRTAILVVLAIAIILIHHPPKKARTQPTVGNSTSGYATPSLGFWQLLLASYWFVARSATGSGLFPCISNAACHAALLLAAAELLEALSPPSAGAAATANMAASDICDVCGGSFRSSAAAVHGRYSVDVATASDRWSPRASLVDVPSSPKAPGGGRLGISRSMGFGARAGGHGARRRRNSLITASQQGPEGGAALPHLAPGAFLPSRQSTPSSAPPTAPVAATASRVMAAEAPCAPGSPPPPPPSLTAPAASSLEATDASRDDHAIASAPLPGGPSHQRAWPQKLETARSAASRQYAVTSASGSLQAGAAAGPAVKQSGAGDPKDGGGSTSPSGGSSSGPPSVGFTMAVPQPVPGRRTQDGSQGKGQGVERKVVTGEEEGSLQGRSMDAAASGLRGTGVAASVVSQPGTEKRSSCGALQPVGSVAGSGSAHGVFTLIINPLVSGAAAPPAASQARYTDGCGDEDEKGDEGDRGPEVNEPQALAAEDEEEEYDSEAYRHTYDSEDCFSLHGAVDGNGAIAEGVPYDQRMIGVPYGSGAGEGRVWRDTAVDSTARICANDAVGVRGVRLDACGPRHHLPHEYMVLPPPDQYECDISDVADLEDLMSLEEVERAAAAGEAAAGGKQEPMAAVSGAGDVAHSMTWVFSDGPQALAGGPGSGAIVLDLRTAANELSRRRLEATAPTGEGELYGSGRSSDDDVGAAAAGTVRPTPTVSPQQHAAAEVRQAPTPTAVAATALPLMDTFLRDAALLAEINSDQHGHGILDLEGCRTSVHGHVADAVPVGAALGGVEQGVVVESSAAPTGPWRASSAALKASLGANIRGQERRTRDVVRHLQPPQQQQLTSSYSWRAAISRKSHGRKLSAGQLLARQVYGIVDRSPGETPYGASAVDERYAGSADLPVAGRPSARRVKRGPYVHHYHSFSIAAHQRQQQHELQSQPAPQTPPSQLHASSELLAMRQQLHQLQDIQEYAASHRSSQYHVLDDQHPLASTRTPRTPGSKRSEERAALTATRQSMDAAVETSLTHHHCRSPLSSAAAVENSAIRGPLVASGAVAESIRMTSAGATGWQSGQRHQALRVSGGGRRHGDLMAGASEQGLRTGDVDVVATIAEQGEVAVAVRRGAGGEGGAASMMDAAGFEVNWSPVGMKIDGIVACMATNSDAPPPGEDEMFGLGEDSEDIISPTAASGECADAEEALRLQQHLLLQKEVLQRQQLMLQQELLRQQQQWLRQQQWVAMPEAGHQPMHRMSGSPLVVLQPSSAKAAAVTCETVGGDGITRTMHRQHQHQPATGATSTATTTTLIEPFSAVDRPQYRSLSQSQNQSSYDSQRRLSDVSTARPYSSVKYSASAAANSTGLTTPVPTAASASAAATVPVSSTNSVATVPSLPVVSAVPSSSLPDSSAARGDVQPCPNGTDAVDVTPPAAEELQDIESTPFLGDQGFRAAVAAAVAADPTTDGDVLPPACSISTSLLTRVTLPSDGGAALGGGGVGCGGTTSPMPQESWGGSATWGGDSELSGPVGAPVEAMGVMQEAANIGGFGAVAQAGAEGEMEPAEGKTVVAMEVSASDGGEGEEGQVGDGMEEVTAGVEREDLSRAPETTPSGCPSSSAAEQEMNGQ